MSPIRAVDPPKEVPRKRLYSVTAVAASLDLGRTKVYELMNAGQLKFVNVGDRRMVREEDLDAFVAGLSGAPTEA